MISTVRKYSLRNLRTTVNRSGYAARPSSLETSPRRPGKGLAAERLFSSWAMPATPPP
jgi:hypothetical protein